MSTVLPTNESLGQLFRWRMDIYGQRMKLSDNDGVSADEEKAAIDALRRKDISGLQTLVRLHQVRAVRTAFLIVGNRDVAEDLVAEAFVKVYERIDRYDARRPFAPWFYRMVVNQALKWLRGTRRHVSLEDAEAWPDESVRPEAMVITRESRRAVIAAILKLPHEQRIAVVLRYYLDMDEREIAEAMQCPWGTVKWRLHSAKSKLRQMLAAHSDRPHPFDASQYEERSATTTG